MEERTFISGISDLIDNVGKCKCYDDARNLLNSFVIENIGKKYETEDGTAYRNSNNPKEIKAETLRVMDDFIRKWLIIDEASTAGLNTGRKMMDKKNVIYDDGTIISIFGNMCNDIERTKTYIETWREEAAPNMNNEIQRLKPKKETIEMIWPLFENLIRLDYFEETNSNKKVWAHLCGISNEIIAERIKWKGTNVEFAALMDNFFVSEFHKTYFDFEEDAPNMEYVVNHFLNKNGKAMNYTSVRSQKHLNNAKLEEIWEKMKKTI